MLVLGLGLESGPWPWPWPRPRLRRSWPRCYHALHLRPGLCGMVCPLDTCLRELWLFLPAQPLLRGFFFYQWAQHPATSCENVRQVMLESLCLPSVPSSANCCDS